MSNSTEATPPPIFCVELPSSFPTTAIFANPQVAKLIKLLPESITVRNAHSKVKFEMESLRKPPAWKCTGGFQGCLGCKLMETNSDTFCLIAGLIKKVYVTLADEGEARKQCLYTTAAVVLNDCRSRFV